MLKYRVFYFCLSIFFAASGVDYQQARGQMVRTQLAARDIHDKTVLRAMKTVPRHEFVTAGYRTGAYADRPLPIGHGQTISQPYIVALMTQLLSPKKDMTVLEVGTGSGYQAAVLSELVKKVYTIEIRKPLYEEARKTFLRLKYKNVISLLGDGFYGWEKQAPYDAIIVTCAPSSIPPPLIKQLKPGGVMVIPVGPVWGIQKLYLIRKDKKGRVKSRFICGVRFVPLTSVKKQK